MMLLAEGFEITAMSTASSRATPGLRFVTEKIPSECIVTETIDAGINEKVIDGLTDALTSTYLQ